MWEGKEKEETHTQNKTASDALQPAVSRVRRTLDPRSTRGTVPKA